MVAAGLAIPGTLAHWYLGHMDWELVLLLSVSSIPCSYLGAKLAIKTNNRVLEYVFAGMLIVFGLVDMVYTLSHYTA